MAKKQLLLLTFLALFLSACGKPVPPDKTAYIGKWQSKTMYLVITKEGDISYKRVKGKQTTTINAPLKGFNGNDFEVGIGPLSTMFKVNKPPYQDGDQWKIIVDEVVLTKT